MELFLHWGSETRGVLEVSLYFACSVAAFHLSVVVLLYSPTLFDRIVVCGLSCLLLSPIAQRTVYFRGGA